MPGRPVGRVPGTSARVVAILVAGVLLGGCMATSGGPKSTEERISGVQEDHTPVVMENAHWRPVHAYLIRDGRTLHDVLIGSQEIRVASVRNNLLEAGRVGFRLEVVGTPEQYWTTATVVPVGAEFHLLVESPLRLSYTFLR